MDRKVEVDLPDLEVTTLSSLLSLSPSLSLSLSGMLWCNCGFEGDSEELVFLFPLFSIIKLTLCLLHILGPHPNLQNSYKTDERGEGHPF